MSELSQTTARGIVERIGAGQPKDPRPLRLPTLPAPHHSYQDGAGNDWAGDYYSAEQLRAYAGAAIGSPVLLDVQAERARQDLKWGGAAHDDAHETSDFVELIEDYAGWARVMAGMGSDDKARVRLIQVAALAVAAVESIDRRGTVCPNCDTPVPPGCDGQFKGDASCRLRAADSEGGEP